MGKLGCELLNTSRLLPVLSLPRGNAAAVEMLGPVLT